MDKSTPVTVKSVLSGHSKRRHKIGFQAQLLLNAVKSIAEPKIGFQARLLLNAVKSIAECSKRAFCNTFDLH